MGFGYAMAYPATNITAVAGARTDEQGLASGLFIASFQVGSGVILGVVASVFISAGHAANAGLGGYRAGILTTIGASGLSLLICVAMIIRHRAAAGAQPPAEVQRPEEVQPPAEIQRPADVRQPVEETEMT
jgi:MFS family permease